MRIPKRRRLWTATLLLLASAPSIANAETICHMTLPATGSAGEDTTMIFGFSHEVLCPQDAASALPTGEHRHGPVNVTKPVDKSSGGLMEALVSGRALRDSILIECESLTPPSAADTGGAESHHYTIELSNVVVSEIRTELVLAGSLTGGADPGLTMIEELTLAYEGIEIRYGAQGGQMTVLYDDGIEISR